MRRRAMLRALGALGATLGAPALGAVRKVDFPEVVPGHRLVFPRDEGAHPAFRIEWWYITGWLEPQTRGFQITFFRARNEYATDNPSRFTPRQILFAHAALADPQVGHLLHDQHAAREGFTLAAAEQGRARVWIDDWRLEQTADGYRSVIPAREFVLGLSFQGTRAPLLQGDAGYSRKGPRLREASYYYSRPQLEVSGSIEQGRSKTAVRGRAWFDHEWSSAYLPPEASGWDWIGVNLEDGGALMAFAMRARAGGVLYAGATLLRSDGSKRSVGPQAVRFVPTRRWRSPRTGVEYPVAMRVEIEGTSWHLEPLMDDQELDSRLSTGTIYWEGAVRVSRDRREVGRGYLELTGYWRPMTMGSDPGG